MELDINEFAVLLENRYENVTFETIYEDNLVLLTADLEVQEYFDDVLLKVKLAQSGYCSISFIFDEIKDTLEVYNLMNYFNVNSLYKGYILEIDFRNYFTVEMDTILINSVDEALEFVDTYLSEILSEYTLELLLPITKLTFQSSKSY